MIRVSLSSHPSYYYLRIFFFSSICFGTLSSISAADKVDFSHEIVPILRARCAECHAGDNKKGGFSINDRLSALTGGESGRVIELGNAGKSYLMELVKSDDPDVQMPPQGKRLTTKEIETLARWIDEGAAWEAGFTFDKQPYEPSLELTAPTLPPATDGREHPIDRLIDHYLAERKIPRPQGISDRVFLRRSSLDLVGLLPNPDRVRTFVESQKPGKRTEWLEELLTDDVGYADHWMSFWNDLLRNDYSGTGFITGGRKQISTWLYRSLIDNKPFDRMVHELVSPTDDESRGFIDGIKWRGEVSAGQTIEIQFTQSVAQSFLGINMKCASCHDSFIDRWKLKDAYGLAAIYASKPLAIHRCDKATGEVAVATWLYPELGNVDPQATATERLRQLADLVTSPRNGRFSRTIVNRLWHRMMGRGLVNPVDAMQTEPWHEALLDHLASHFVEISYDLRKMLLYIATSEAYQSTTESQSSEPQDTDYHYAGPRARRLTAEQFLDAVWTVSGKAPLAYDAPIVRGKVKPAAIAAATPAGKWIWAKVEETENGNDNKNTILFLKNFTLNELPKTAGIVITANREYSLFINHQLIGKDADFKTFEMFPIHKQLKQGENTIAVIAQGPTNAPANGVLYVDAIMHLEDEREMRIASDESWQFSTTPPAVDGRKLNATHPENLDSVTIPSTNANQRKTIENQTPMLLARAGIRDDRMIRASLVKNSFLMRSLGRPNRDQIVSMRPNDLTTLEAMDLSNGQPISDALVEAGKQYAERFAEAPTELVSSLYEQILTREATPEEMQISTDVLGTKPRAEAVEDLCWALFMSPEFQYIR